MADPLNAFYVEKTTMPTIAHNVQTTQLNHHNNNTFRLTPHLCQLLTNHHLKRGNSTSLSIPSMMTMHRTLANGVLPKTPILCSVLPLIKKEQSTL